MVVKTYGSEMFQSHVRCSLCLPSDFSECWNSKFRYRVFDPKESNESVKNFWNSLLTNIKGWHYIYPPLVKKLVRHKGKCVSFNLFFEMPPPLYSNTVLMNFGFQDFRKQRQSIFKGGICSDTCWLYQMRALVTWKSAGTANTWRGCTKTIFIV